MVLMPVAKRFEVDNVLFDCSGTIINDMEPVYRAHVDNCVLHDMPVMGFDKWREMSPRITGARDVYRIICENSGLTKDYDILYDDYSKFYQQAREDYPPVPRVGVSITFDALAEQGKMMGVVSAHPQVNLECDLSRFGFDGYMSFMEGGVHDKGKRIAEICSERGLDISRTCYVGDTNRDIQSARRAGVIAIGDVGGYVNERVIDNTLMKLEKAGYPHSKIYEMPELLEILI